MADDDDDDDEKPPPLRLVSENPNARTERQETWAKEEAQRTLSRFAVALLRTMAGSDTESIYFMRRLSDFLDALSKLREQAGRGLTVIELETALRLPQTEYVSSQDVWRHRQWLRDDGMETVVKGALRLAAHKILGEEPAFGGMHSERVIEQGIETLEELKRPPSPLKPQPRQTKKGLAASWDDVDLGLSTEALNQRFGERLAPTTGVSRRKNPDRSAEFSQDDLKELRKAIKAKDDKRIAELTAKIARPPSDD